MIGRDKVVLFGSFGGWNSGDEAILESVERLLGWSVSSSDVELKERSAVICFRMRPGFAQIYQKRRRQVVYARELWKIAGLLRTRQLIIGGGQIITGDRSYKGLLFLLLLTTLARLLGRPAVMVGIGVEGVHRKLAKWLCRCIVANVSVLNCRDAYSQKMLLDAGCSEHRLRLMADVVLSGVIARDTNKGLFQRPTIAIGLHHANRRKYATGDDFVLLSETLVNTFPEYEVVFVSNDCRDGFDEELLRQLRGRIQHDRIRFQSFDTVENVVSAYASAKCVISVRMHPLILGLIHSVPVVGVGRSNKVKQLADRVGFELIDPREEDVDAWLTRVRAAIEASAPDIKEIQEMAYGQFQF